MAIRNTIHVLKNSDIVNRPLPSSLLGGEPIVNTADGIMYFSGVTTSTSEWTPAGTGTTANFFEVGSNLYDLKIRNQITAYNGLTNLSGKFLSGTTSGFELANISDIMGVDTFVTGNTLNVANNNTNTQSAQLDYNIPVVGGPYFITTQNTFTTGGTYNSGTTSIDFDKNDGTTFSVDLSNIDVNDTFVTGGTVTSLGDLDLFRNDGVTVTIPKVTYWTSGSTGLDTIKAINNTGLDATGDRSVAWGNQTLASGNDSTVWGVQTSATTIGSTASGYLTLASGDYSHTEGSQTTASGQYSHAEGDSTLASGQSSHAEGENTLASGYASHAEGQGTTASAYYSHAEGQGTTASGYGSHAEGVGNTASGDFSHAEGEGTFATGRTAHSEGYQTTASNYGAHAEGQQTIASGEYSHAEGYKTVASGNISHSQGSGTTANGIASFASGVGSITQTDGTFIHSENSIVSGQRSVVLGGQNITGSTNDTVYVPYLNLNLTPTLNNSNTEILSRNTSTGQVEYTSLSSITSTDTFVTGFTYNPSNNTFTISRNQGQPDLTALIDTMTGLTVTGDAVIEGSLTVFGSSISAFTSNLYVEDSNITLNYNPTGSTTITSIGAGWTIQDGSGISNTATTLNIGVSYLNGNLSPNTEYTASTGNENRNLFTQLGDIIIRNTNYDANSPDGVRVLAEGDILSGGFY